MTACSARYSTVSRGDNKSTNEIEKWAWDNHKQLLTTDGLFFPCEGEDGIRWDLAKRLAHAEWLRISRRYRNMQKYLMDSGYLVGRAPYGYQIVGVDCGESPCTCKNDRKTLEINPDTSAIIRQMAEMILDGKSRQGVALWLNQRGIPSSDGAKWYPKNVNRILRSETLIGRRKTKDTGKLLLRFEPIFTMEEWNALQAALDVTTLRRGKVRDEPAMLVGVAYCAKCKRPLHYRETPKTRKAGYTYTWKGYRCDGPNHTPSTCMVMVTAETLHGWVNLQMTSPEIGPRKVIEVDVIPGHNHDEEIYKVEQDISDLDQDDPDYDEKHAGLRAERKRLREAPEVPPKLDETVTGETVAELWDRITEAEKRDYLLRAKAKVFVGGKRETDNWSLDVEEPNVLTRLSGSRLTV
jgi:hypothetical protein